MPYPWSNGDVLTATDLNAAFTLLSSSPVKSFNGRTGQVNLSSGDVTTALGYTPVRTVAGRTGAVTLTASDLNDWSSAIAPLAPLNSPHFVGTPTALTATLGTNTTQLATTAFVHAAVTSLGGVAVTSVAGRIGDVTLTHADLTDWSTATSSFLTSAPVSTVAGRTGAVTLAVADVSGAAPLASPALTGTPSVPTAATSTNTTQAASTAFVLGQAGTATPVVNGSAAVGTSVLFARQDHVHGTDTTRAPLASPTFTGTVTIPSGASISGYLTTTSAASTYAPLASPTFTGSPTVPGYLTTASAATTYAPLASPTFTGTPAAPTATAGDDTTQLATTAFVTAAVTASTSGVASFNTRTGAVTLSSGDVTTALTFTPYNATNPTGYQTAANVTATLASPPAIGGSAAAAGSFTTLSASSTVSGSGFTTLLSPYLTSSTAASTYAPLVVASSAISTTGGSTTLISSQYNNAILLISGTLASNATLVVPNTGQWTVSNGTAGAFTLTIKTSAGAGITIAQGYADIVVANGTDVVRADSDMSYGVTIVGGSIDNATVGAANASTGRFTTVTSTIATGTAPFTVASTTNVANLNASSLSGATFAAPGAVGSGTASTGAFTTLSASSTVSGTGFSTYLASPPSIGGSAAAAGSFTTLSASSTVSGSGFTTLLSPYLTSSTASSTYAPLASPTFSGTPSLPTGTTGVTQTAGDNTTKIATTAFVTTATAGSGAGGGAVSSPGTNQTLTSASSLAQSYAFSAAGLTVTLPDATTLSKGGPVFSLYNAGSYTFGVRRNGATLLTAVAPGCVADLYLDDNGTAAGSWHAAGQGLQTAFEILNTTLSGAVVTANTTLLGFIGSVAIYFGGSAANTSIQAYDTVGNTVGSVATLTSAATSPILLPVDSTHGLIVYYGSSNICAQVLTLSGTTITVQTQATVSTGTPTALATAVTLTTGSSYLVGYNVSTGAYAVQLGVSGTTATFGTAVSSGGAVSWIATRPLLVISSTQVFGTIASTINSCRVIGISGTTVTMNTAAAVAATPTIGLMLSTTLFLICNGSTSVQAVSVSGTTVTAGSQNTNFGANNFTTGQWAVSGTSFIVGNTASPGVLYYGTISGTTITMAASVTMANDFAAGGTSAATTLLNNPVVAVSAGYIYVPTEGVLTASGSAFSLAQPDLWPDQMVISGSAVLQDGSGGMLIPLAAGDGFACLATAQASGNLLVKPGRIYPVGGYTAALSGAISTGKFVVGTTYPGRTAPTGTGALWRVGVWEVAT